MEEADSLYSKVAAIKKSKTKSVLSLILLLSLIALLSVFSIKWYKIQAIQNIKISGNTILTNSEINNIISSEIINVPQEGINLFQIKEKLKSNPYIADADVWFNSKGILGIEITERFPVAIVINPRGETEFVDKYGTIIPYRLYKEFSDLPIITNVYFNGKVNNGALLGALLIVDGMQNTMPQYNNLISEIRYDNKNRSYELHLADSNLPILFGRTDNVADKLEKLYTYWKTHLSTEMFNLKIQRLDVRWNDMIIVSY